MLGRRQEIGSEMNQELEEIRPKSKARLMDLVQKAGVDVSDWANYKKGPKHAASNPKYCYEWSFVQPGKVVVLNLWFGVMQQEKFGITSSFNMRKLGDDCKRKSRKAMWTTRAYKMDEAIQEAAKNSLLIRVIVCDGSIRGLSDPDQKASSVRNRMLDPKPWSITKYDVQTGEYTLTRGGAIHSQYVDQFEDQIENAETPERVDRTGSVFKRDQKIRQLAMERANGLCEYCGKPGFKLADGRVFLETHHIIPLSAKGPDVIANVAALCPNHHREAHHGVNAEVIRGKLSAKKGVSIL